MQEKSILILTNRVPYPLNDGGNMAMNAMIKAYHAQGWKVSVLSMNTTRHYVSQQVLAGLYKELYAFETVDVDNDLKPLLTIKNYLFSSLPNHAERFYDKGFENTLVKTLLDFKPSVIHIESVFLSEYMPVIKTNSMAKTVLRVHNIEWQVWDRLAKETSGMAKKIYLSNLAKRIKEYEVKVWGLYDILLPITEHDAQIISESASSVKVSTIPFGIDFSEKQSNAEQWVGYHIGAMDWRPNSEAIDWFLKTVWPVVHQQMPSFSFSFAGRNMPARYKYLDIEGVTCAGEVEDADAFIADKKLLIVPLRSGGGVRIKILEAMGRGKLVISTSIGMQGIDAIQGVHYLQADDPDAFASQIARALNDKEMALKVAANAMQLIHDKYRSETIARKLTDTVSSLL